MATDRRRSPTWRPTSRSRTCRSASCASPTEHARVVVRIGDHVLDLAAAGIAPELTGAADAERADGVRARSRGPRPGRRSAAARAAHADAAARQSTRSRCCCRSRSATSSTSTRRSHHATNLGRILRPGHRAAAAQLAPAPGRLPRPVGHGRRRAARPSYVRTGSIARRRRRGPPRTRRVRSTSSSRSASSSVARRAARIAPRRRRPTTSFGVVLLNDWSARDIQGFEYQPLGPNLAKSFATSISPWVVTLDALRTVPRRRAARRTRSRSVPPRRTAVGARPAAARRPQRHRDHAYQLRADVLDVRPAARPHDGQRGDDRAGDLFGSGTVSGPTPRRARQHDRADRGAVPIPSRSPTARTRSFLDDGDTVTMRGWCGGAGRPRIGFGEVARHGRPPPSTSRTSAETRRTDMPYYRGRRRHPPQAPHGAPRRRSPSRRGADGRRRLLRHVVVALPPPLAERDRAHRSAVRHPAVSVPPEHAAAPSPSAHGELIEPPAAAADPVHGRVRCSATTTSRSRGRRRRHRVERLYRNAIGDELVYVQSGTAVLESVFGRLPVGAGDYVVDPDVDHAPVGRRTARVELLVITARGHVDVPAQVPQRHGPAARGRAVQRARPARTRTVAAGHDARRRATRCPSSSAPAPAWRCTSTPRTRST